MKFSPSPKWLTPLSAALCLFLAALNTNAQSSALVPLFGPGERILFQGDSITDMNRGRTDDPNHILGHSYVFLIASRHGAAYPERNLVFINRGISGSTVASLAARWKADTLDLKPDVLSVLIGINDIFFSKMSGKPIDYVELEKKYDRMLIEAREQNPALKLVLCEPFILPGKHNDGTWELWHNAVTQLQAMTARLAERHKAALVHFQRIFDEAAKRAPASTWIWDGIHPTYSGHQLLADEWQRAYAEYLTPASPKTGDNNALIPTPKLEQDSYDWYARHLAVLELQNSFKPDIVMIGDSITHFWAGEPRANNRNGPLAWDKTFAGKRVLNMGFGWDRTQNVLWRLEHGQMDGLSPKAIILNIGTNNLTGTKNARTSTPAELVEAITLICRKLHAKSPGSRILVMGVFPRGTEPDASLRAPIKAINALLPAALKDLPQVSFLDIGGKFLTPDGTLPRDLFPDSTHPSEKGYSIWGQALLDSGILGLP